MIKEFERAALTIDLPEFGFMAGDVGTVVDISPDGEEISLEFFSFSGKTVGVVAVLRQHVRALTEDEVMHARALKMP